MEGMREESRVEMSIHPCGVTSRNHHGHGSINTHEQYYPLSTLCSPIKMYALYTLSGTQHHLCIDFCLRH